MRERRQILSPMNKGMPFRIFKLDGKTIAIVDEVRSFRSLHAWMGTDLVSSDISSKAEKEEIFLPRPPEVGYVEEEAVIGGVGKHLRWNVVLPSKQMKDTDEVDLIVQGRRSQVVRVADISSSLSLPCPLFNTSEGGEEGDEQGEDDSDGEEEDEEDPLVQWIVSVPNRRVGETAAHFHNEGFASLPLDPNYAIGKLGIERCDRSDHMWCSQSSSTAGPLRDTHRWNFSHLPPSWSTLPFTWKAMAKEVDDDSLLDDKEVRRLPQPLRNYVIDERRERVRREEEGKGEGEERLSRLSRMRERDSVTCRLRPSQNRQLLSVAYWLMLLPLSDKVQICQLLAFRYMLHGYCGREIGMYRQQAQHLGHGATIRSFQNKDQYLLPNLSNRVLNRIYQSDGSLKGSGFKGSRGKHVKPGTPVYRPKKRMKRHPDQDARMRRQKVIRADPSILDDGAE